ncbi:tRNA cyclic N6-threonylcarbamoyladenosine(37) synthase TcdA [Chitiniphilus shinanonensis]|uniref:tRNA cyclic N6-threonylcarbamoyladenosine(37) synthase TcdA n=1 Tax=Chitiniphilus shinanonensis TaxID=553088 RepID=A0ABQ6BS27_9NEIS|nr:tRNA cyclic N6-threonylcarbamoyladenosine(37) synthase TcdA [Chitiniphilus shinanonensis]GLS04294.1 tRNA cyclic N6-threonylcarbamoyladenosine(37) synthase TcdA [Chitiniphilus shinanonensis]
MDTSYERRFGGIARLYGRAALERFRTAHVCVIGVGGVGSWAAEALARSGIGAITLIDLDDICVSNTNRQLPAHDGNFGKAKVLALAERLHLINPDCTVHAVEDFVVEDSLEAHLGRGYDYVVDAIDSVRIKAQIIAWCRRHKVRLITTGGAGGQTDPTQIRIDDLTRTTQDPLASKVRNLLRREYGFPKGDKKFGVECVYSTEQLVYPQADGSVCARKPEGEGGGRLDCQGGFGASLVVTGSFGFAAVSRVLRKLADSVA